MASGSRPLLRQGWQTARDCQRDPSLGIDPETTARLDAQLMGAGQQRFRRPINHAKRGS